MHRRTVLEAASEARKGVNRRRHGRVLLGRTHAVSKPSLSLPQTNPAAAHAAWAAHYGHDANDAAGFATWSGNVGRWAGAAAARGEKTLALNGIAAIDRETLLAGLTRQQDGPEDEAATLAAFPYAFEGRIGRKRPRPPPPPPSVDWRAAGIMGPVKNQHRDNISCGCCYTFAATGVTEACIALADHVPPPSLSEQQLIDCDRGPPFKDKGCKGGSVEEAIDYIRRNGGLDSEDDYPYTGQHAKGTSACVARKETRHVARVSKYIKVPRRSEAALKAAVAQHPVSVAVCCGDFIDDWHAYTGPGVMTFGANKSETGCARPLDHAVVVVGYFEEDAVHGPHWLWKNAWGEGFGEGGYFRLRMGVEARDGAAGMLNLGGFPLPAKKKSGDGLVAAPLFAAADEE